MNVKRVTCPLSIVKNKKRKKEKKRGQGTDYATTKQTKIYKNHSTIYNITKVKERSRFIQYTSRKWTIIRKKAQSTKRTDNKTNKKEKLVNRKRHNITSGK